MIIKSIKQFSYTCQTSTILLIVIILPSILAFEAKFYTKPNICSRCDFNGGKKVKPCPKNFDQNIIEVIECGYDKPICGITINITTHRVIYAGCFSDNFKRHCFIDRIAQYSPKKSNLTYCYHTCSEFFCNPFESWLNSEKSGFNLFKSILG